ncbi:MAG: 3-oxoacyl-ACP reductase family protein, partial [Rhodovibrionaceae bacterium]
MVSSPYDLTGKTALVTGASSGIGRHLARVLAKAGARVAIAARRTDALAELAEEIAEAGGRAMPVRLDVGDAASVRDAVACAETELGGLSILVNNAGIAVTKPLFEQEEADWDRVIDTNLKGAWLMSREAARHMAERERGGSIVNIASVLGMQGSGQVTAYCASKGGLINMTRALAADLAGYDIRVNALAPGYIETDINRDFLASKAGQSLQKRVPQRRFGQVRDLDGPLLLLASDASAYMTGAVITVDGGMSAVA